MPFRICPKLVLLSCFAILTFGWLVALAEGSKDVPEGNVTLSDSPTKKAKLVHIVNPVTRSKPRKTGLWER